VLQTLIDSRTCWPGKNLYTCFVDFRKTFDTVPREKLWRVLEGIGVGWRFLACLRSMYSQDQACVSHPTEGFSNTFPYTIGVKRGCPLSPLLFGLYIDALESRIIVLAGDDSLDLAGTAVKLLPYADDLVLMSKSLRGLQKQLDELIAFCKEWDLTVNVKKTKVVVFGSKVNSSPSHYDGSPVEEVASFCYLGIELHRSGSLKTDVEHLAAAGQKAIFALRQRYVNLKINDPAIVCQLFDALVKSVLSYGCELWVDEPATKSLEAIHRSFLKSLLSVNDTTPSWIVLAEFGKFPLILLWRQQALKYKAKMSTSLPSHLMSLAYSVQQALSSRQKCWLRKLQNWDSEGDTQPSSQVPPSMASMQQIFLDSWLTNYFRLYGSNAYGFQAYLSLVDNVQFKKCLSCFRCSNHCLEIETGHRTKPLKTPICERLCKQCSLGAIEDEDHFLLVCPTYEHIRDKFRHHLPIGPITSIQELVSCQNQFALARFIEQCLQIRTQ